jgi:Spy/CpxP family protein refolding chaperone
MRKTALCMAVVLAMLTPVLATAFDGPPDRPERGDFGPGEMMGAPRGAMPDGPGGAKLAERLGLADDQKKTLREQFVAFKERTRQTRMSLMSLNDEKKTMMMSGKVDQTKLAKIDDEIVKLTGQLMAEKQKMKRDMLALLKPEQLEKVADMAGSGGFGHHREHKRGW